MPDMNTDEKDTYYRLPDIIIGGWTWERYMPPSIRRAIRAPPSIRRAVSPLGPNYLTVREAAERRGLAYCTISVLIQQGKLQAIKRGNRSYVKVEDVDVIPKRQQGRPPKQQSDTHG